MNGDGNASFQSLPRRLRLPSPLPLPLPHRKVPDSRKIDSTSSFRPKEKKKRPRNGSKSRDVGNETAVAVASKTKNSTLAVQQNPTVSSELHKTSRFSFQPSAHAEHVQATAHY